MMMKMYDMPDETCADVISLIADHFAECMLRRLRQAKPEDSTV